MKLTLFSIMCTLAMVCPVAAAETTNLVFHVQLIRGSDQATPPTKESKPIGPKLAARLQPIFAWKHYWQVKYEEVPVAPGQKNRARLSAQREVEFDLGSPGKRAVTVYSDGKAMTRKVGPLNAPMTFMGADRDAKSAWFVVVRRDKPEID